MLNTTKKKKFEPKILVWCAISVNGISEMYIQEKRSVAIDSDIYISKCLTKMEKFIKKKHNGDHIIFWPDLASCHYSKKTLDWLKSKKINFVPKDANPPNCPQIRPIEDFWAILSQHVYRDGWEATSAENLKNRIKFCAKKIDPHVIQNLMGGVKSKIRKMEDLGPTEMNH